MEKWWSWRCDAPDASNASGAPNATTNIEGKENEAGSRKGRGIRQIVVGNRSGKAGVLKATGGVGGKGKIETRQSAKDRTASITARKLIAKQGADEKAQLEQWKEDMVAKFTSEIAQLQNEAVQAQYREMENQRVFFTLEIDALKKEVREMKKTEEAEIMALKTTETAATQRSTQGTTKALETPKTPIVPPNIRPNKGSKIAKPVRKSYAQMVASSPAQTWTEVVGKNQKRKSTIPNLPKLEPEKRRVIFRREPTSAQKSEADLMLTLNESLQKAGIPAYTRFSRVRYSQSGAISALLTEKSSAEILVRDHSNMLIRAAKLIDEKVIGIEALERWQRLKVHGMSLARYLGDGKMELLRREIELSTGIQLKTMPQ